MMKVKIFQISYFIDLLDISNNDYVIDGSESSFGN